MLKLCGKYLFFFSLRPTVAGKALSGKERKHKESLKVSDPLLKDKTLAPIQNWLTTLLPSLYNAFRMNTPSKPFKLWKRTMTGFVFFLRAGIQAN